MLCLNRYVGERVKIGDDIWVTVNKVKGKRVSLCIDAPSDKRIVREEIAGTPAKPQRSRGEE